ncbi:hypothetical protein HpBTM60_33840 [Helicobacter pylori]
MIIPTEIRKRNIDKPTLKNKMTNNAINIIDRMLILFTPFSNILLFYSYANIGLKLGFK